MGYNNIGDEGVKFIAQSEKMSMITLYINNNIIGDEGVKYVAQSEHMRNITTLSMHTNNIEEYYITDMSFIILEQKVQLLLNLNT